MEAAVGGANWLLGKVLSKLSNDLVAGYVASSELGLNFDKIKIDLNFTLGLLHQAQGRDISDNPGLQRLLDDLSRKADEAEDALDELHYFMIQDELDGTQEAIRDVGDGLGAQALHARHAARNAAEEEMRLFSAAITILRSFQTGKASACDSHLLLHSTSNGRNSKFSSVYIAAADIFEDDFHGSAC